MITLPTPKTVIEPFRIKTVERLPMPSAEERQEMIKKAHYNLFNLPAQAVTFDFLTDSGTSAMSATQWAGIMVGDESYAGSVSYQNFETSVRDITGYKHIIPTHQGRAAETLLFKTAVKPGQAVVGNTHFDTTHANIMVAGAEALNMPVASATDPDSLEPFKGNMDLDALSAYLKENSKKVPFVIMTVTSNSVGGQPVSLENIKATRKILNSYKIPMYLDAARFAENAYFIKLREKGYENKTVKEIAREVFDQADGALMSAKKDAFGNIGGFLALNDESIASEVRSQMVLTEGFPTYGGMAGRDMEALAIGLREILDENYLRYRIQSTKYLAMGLEEAGIKTMKPTGGHAVYIDAGTTLPHIPALEYPGQSLSVAMYQSIGIRGVEIGSVMLGHRDHETGEEHTAPKELVRLAIPRRVYTQSHADYIIESAHHLKPHLESLKGYKFTYQPQYLRHFTAKFAPL